MNLPATLNPVTPATRLTLSGAKSIRPRQAAPRHPASEDAPPSLDGGLPDSGVLPSMLDLFDHLCAEGWPRQHTGLNTEDGPPLDAYGMGEFVREHLIAAPGTSLTVAQAYSAYRTIRDLRALAVMTRNSFDGLVDCQVEHHLQLRLCHDSPNGDGIPQPGWQGIKLA